MVFGAAREFSRRCLTARNCVGLPAAAEYGASGREWRGSYGRRNRLITYATSNPDGPCLSLAARADSAASTPLGDATVSIVGTTLGVTTGADGRFTLDRVPPGAVTVRVRLLGYRTVDRAVRVRAGDTVRVDVVLQTDAQLLSGVRTDARRADAELFLTRPNIATITMNAAAMAGVPSVGEPDVIRLVQLLPGVAARNDFNTGLNVRGGEADQNLVLLDGYQIYNPFHLGGLSSTFMDATVGGIELMTGAFPSRFGGRLSSVLDVKSAEDVRTGLHASADISVLATTGRVAGSFGGKGTWSIAARRTYADKLASIFTNNIFPYHFTDFHGRATYALPGDVRLAVTAYGGRDVLDANLAEFETDTAPTKAIAGQWKFNWGNQVVGATASKDLAPGATVPLLGFLLGDSTTVAMSLSSSGFSTLLDLGDGALSQRSEVRDVRLGLSLVTRGESHDR
jgi:hypothetical protein